MATIHQKFIPVLLVLAISVSMMATDLYLPAMPLMVDFFSSTDNYIQKSISAYQLGLFLSAVVYGPLSDSYGRRNVFLFGFALFFFSSALLLLAESTDQLLWLRLLQGCGGGVSSAISPAIIRDHYAEKQSTKITAQMSIVILLTPAIAPILGGYLTTYFGWRSCFVFIFLIVAFTFFVLFKFFPEKASESSVIAPRVNSLFKNYKQVLSNKTFFYYVLFHSLTSCSLWCYITVMPFAFIKYMDVSPEVFGYFVCAQVSAVSLTYMYVQRIVSTKDPTHLMHVGLTLLGLGSFGLIAAAYFAPQSPWISTMCIIPYMMGSPFIFPTSMSRAMSCAGSIKGTASSCIAASRQIFSLIGSLAAAAMPDQTLMPAALFMSATIIVMFISLKIATRNDQTNPSLTPE